MYHIPVLRYDQSTSRLAEQGKMSWFLKDEGASQGFWKARCWVRREDAEIVRTRVWCLRSASPSWKLLMWCGVNPNRYCHRRPLNFHEITSLSIQTAQFSEQDVWVQSLLEMDSEPSEQALVQVVPPCEILASTVDSDLRLSLDSGTIWLDSIVEVWNIFECKSSII